MTTLNNILDTDNSEFDNHHWQRKNTIDEDSLLDFLLNQMSGDRPVTDIIDDVAAGLKLSSMAVRLTPYILSRINWEDFEHDPIRRQFIPLASEYETDHPKLSLDSLHEQKASPVIGLVHRYPHKALFLPQHTCPVYCRYCTRSYATGDNTEQVIKAKVTGNIRQWDKVFEYLLTHPEIQDIVVSGGDCYNLSAIALSYIGNELLNIPTIRRIRFATKGLAVNPCKILTDQDWTNALIELSNKGRLKNTHVCLHTHFNHPNEISNTTRLAASHLFRNGVTVRNQSVLLRGINDTAETMITLIQDLADMNVMPYYVYIHDMVSSSECLRTPLSTQLKIEKAVQGVVAGFCTPTFITDCPGGGGKCNSHSYDFYDPLTGISVYSAPFVKPGEKFLFFDPLSFLSPEIQDAWKKTETQESMINFALNQCV